MTDRAADTGSAGEPKGILSGKRIVVTRAVSQAGELAQRIEALGGEVIGFPTIEIQPPQSYRGLDTAIRQIQSYDWVIFTSVNGVDAFLQRLNTFDKAPTELFDTSLGAIGPETGKRLAQAGLEAVLVPDKYMAEGILEVLGSESMRGKRVLIPRASRARDVLPQTLRKWGATVDVAETYRTGTPSTEVSPLRRLIGEGKIDMITFTSSSTATNFISMMGLKSFTELPTAIAIACIGPITQRSVEELGGRADVVATEFTIAGLVRAIADYFEHK